MNAVSDAARVDKVPWVSLFIIAAVFFFTVHNVKYTRYFAERGVSGYIVTEEEAEQIMSAFEKGQASKAVAYFVLGVFGALSFLYRARNHIRMKDLFSAAVIFFLCWAFFSILWADNFLSTLNKLIILAMLCAAIMGAMARFSNRDILYLTFYSLAGYVAIGVLSEVAMGSFKPWVAGYRFSGTCHPNGQAIDCAFLVFASWAMYSTERRPIYILAGVTAFVLLYLTKSRTSAACLLLAPALLWGLGLTRIQKVAFVSFAIAVVCLGMLLADTVLPALQQGAMMGRTDADVVGRAGTLTGRTDLWEEVIDTYISERPLLGYGYNSFWTLEHVEEVYAAINFIPGNAHSAFIEVFLGLGLFGFVAYILIYLWATIRTIARYHAAKDVSYGFFGLLLVFAIVHGLTESTFLFPSLTTFLVMLIFARLAFQDFPENDEPVAELPRPRTNAAMAWK